MKKLKFIIILASIVYATMANAQKPIKVFEDSILIGANHFPGLTVTIPEVDYEKTLKNWIKEQESGTKSRVVTGNGEMTIFGAIKKEVTSDPLNIYSKLANQDTLQKLTVCFELKKDEYIEPSAGDIAMTSAKTYLKEFAKSQYIDFIKGEVQAEEKKLRELNNELGSLLKNESRTKRGAQSDKNTIRDEQDKLLVKNNELNLLSTEIINQNNLLISMEAGPGRDAKTAQIKELEKRKNKLQKGINRSENSIGKAKTSINQADRALPKNENQQGKMRERIEEQEAVVQKFIDKLNAVKAY